MRAARHGRGQQQLLQLVEQVAVVLGQEGDRLAGLARAPRPPDPVRVRVDGLGHVVVDDEADVLDVDAAPRHVGGHQDVLGAGLQTRQGELTLLLPLATVQRGGVVAEKEELLSRAFS